MTTSTALTRSPVPGLLAWMAIAITLPLGVTLSAGTEGPAGSPPARQEARSTPPDFLFGQPDGWIGFRVGWLAPRARSDWFAFVSDQLTIDAGAFRTADLSGDFGIGLAPRVDAVASVAFNRATVPSEYRRFVDNNRLPINQETRLQTVHLTASAKVALRSRGRAVSRLAWVPRDVVPFVGGGGGALYYSLEQSGDFVDFRDSRVFPSVFRSQAWTPSAQVFGGVDIRLLRRALATVDARYHWASARLGSTWVDFEPIDLSGFKLSAGMQLLF